MSAGGDRATDRPPSNPHCGCAEPCYTDCAYFPWTHVGKVAVCFQTRRSGPVMDGADVFLAPIDTPPPQ